MTAILYLIPIALGLGMLGLFTFIWSVRVGQYHDLDGDRYRILEEEDKPLPPDIARQRRKLLDPNED